MVTAEAAPAAAADALHEQASALHRAGRLDAAAALYARALEMDPAHGPSLHMAGMLAFQQGEPALCLKRLQQAVAGGYRTAALFDHHGVVLQRLGDAAGAVASFRASLALDPEAGGVWFNLGVAERQAGAPGAAAAAFAEAAARLRQPAAEHMLGVVLQEAGQLEEAAAAYRRALALDPCAGESALNAGVLAQQSGDLAGAAALYRQASAHMADGLPARANLAAALRESGEAQAAAEACRAILAEVPASPEALNTLGLIQRSLGLAEEAEALFRRALAADAFCAAASDNLAALLQETGRPAAAVAARRQVCADHPAEARAWLDLARVLASAGEAEAPALRQALALDPGLAEAHARFGDLAQAQRRWTEAAGHYREAAARAPRRKEPLLGLALTALKSGDGQAARAATQAALALDRFDQCAIAYHALALRLCGDESGADWLTAPDSLVTETTLPGVPLAELAAALRAVRNRAFAPAGQSVRGGTQTQEELFAEPAPVIQAFRHALDAALAQYLAERPRDDAHPFLAARPQRLHYHSWSVVLRAGGHHVPHIHPGGCISGVFYVAVPGEGAAAAGCLEIGRPGIAVALPALPPLRLVVPTPGRLVLFPSYAWHGTRPFSGDGERITIAFDVRSGAAPLPAARW